MPQSNYIFDRDGCCLVDFIGRFEHLQHDYMKVVEMINLQDISLKHMNSGYKQAVVANASDNDIVRRADRFLRTQIGNFIQPDFADWRDYYDSETRSFVEQFYAEDIDRFSYSFDE